MFRPSARIFRQAATATTAAAPLRRAPHPSLHLSSAVAKALSPTAPHPLVALESTIITHGLPYPYNLDVALELEAVVRDNGAVPATIALLDGRPLVGLEDADLQRLAKCAEDPAKNTAIKASRRDISHVLAKGQGAVGGTTVSGTMVLAHMAGIEIFATGGIGGVHRGGEASLDVSADLTELGRTPVSVFCSGPKSILDIPRTLEVLETNGVSVQTFNPSGEFPAFYTSSSGLHVPYVGSTSQAAASILINSQLALGSGQVFGVPIPSSFEAVGNEIQKNVEIAVRESVEQGIDRRGKEATPWLLKRLAQLIPESKESNRALVVNNAKVAAQVAAEMERMRADFEMGRNTYSFGGVSGSSEASAGSGIMIFGAAAIDVTSQASSSSSHTQRAATTYPGRVGVSLGGVSRNVAEAVHKVLASPALPSSSRAAVKLVSPRGDDAFGSLLEGGMKELGMRTDGLFVVRDRDERTAVCSLTLDDQGDLMSGVADMDIGTRYLVPTSSAAHGDKEREVVEYLTANRPRIVAFDGNLGSTQIHRLLSGIEEYNSRSSSPSFPSITTVFEPTSLAKSTTVLDALSRLSSPDSSSAPLVGIATPNVLELSHMHRRALSLGLFAPPTQEDIEVTSQMRSYLALPAFITAEVLDQAMSFLSSSLFNTLLVKFGSKGVLSLSRANGIVNVKHHVATKLPTSAGLNTTGAGDSFAGGVIAGLHTILAQRASASIETLTEQDLDKVVLLGQMTAARSLVSPNAIGSQLDTLIAKAGLVDA
ncbi:uncharacterized protein PFL1_00202 [Pseudozyma flocculosa PF-1]|uniref:Carbohydrate kinase PfkB domain-containing protein n=1 Tax=Pseudozyma flocculosa TaxID=84751 RepID=A0A5C3ESR3_9BASI|nr:uncharacterized protein PFL1_00202 [Pseudozyma flocculosa PF-1]EPQ32004.1 hypothetical protein PFL1_00202 [Pseudozyma flocculosa PF-1]SPO35072.1 uncharacterized protein PSFLO_00543 [Pseudozyma flocculosa]